MGGQQAASGANVDLIEQPVNMTVSVGDPVVSTSHVVFTDVEDSTRMLERGRASAGKALARHLVLVRRVIDRNGGVFASDSTGLAMSWAWLPNQPATTRLRSSLRVEVSLDLPTQCWL